MQTNRIRRARLVKDIVDEYYEPQSHRGSMLDIYRRKVNTIYPMSIPTFYRYMTIAISIDGFIGKDANRIECRKVVSQLSDDRQLQFPF